MRVDFIKRKDVVQICCIYLKKQNERDLVMFALGIYTGLRISDILKLKVVDVKNKDKIFIKQEKTGKGVKIKFNKELKMILDNYIKNRNDNEYLIKSREGINRAITRTQAYRILNDMSKTLKLEREGIEHFGTHTMRKTFGYHTFKLTKDITLVAELLGQTNILHTFKYIGITEMNKNKAINSLKFLS